MIKSNAKEILFIGINNVSGSNYLHSQAKNTLNYHYIKVL